MAMRLLLLSLLWSASIAAHAQTQTLATALNEQIVMLRIGDGWGAHASRIFQVRWRLRPPGLQYP